MTVLDIIKSAFRLLNVYASGETPTADDSADALTTLNMMIDSWNNDGLMIFQIEQKTMPLILNTSQYYIGSSSRPNEIVSATVRDSSNYDYAVKVIEVDEYAAISDKTITGMPNRIYYDHGYTTSKINVWPVPDASYTLLLDQWKKLSEFDALTDTITLPSGYELAIRYNLAVEIAPEFGKTVTNDIAEGARRHKAEIQRLNNRKPFMRMDSALIGRGHYDINSDTYI